MYLLKVFSCIFTFTDELSNNYAWKSTDYKNFNVNYLGLDLTSLSSVKKRGKQCHYENLIVKSSTNLIYRAVCGLFSGHLLLLLLEVFLCTSSGAYFTA